MAHYRKHGRHELPWRETRDAYQILVSEVMLQQTQVERVLPFYTMFVKRFPTARRLADAPLSEVLVAWQGLGYNRRAKMLHAAAREVVARHGGAVPRSVSELERLPGVGPYTARAVAAFAWNEDVVLVETNIRTALIHHFFPEDEKVGDKEIEAVLARALPKGKAREWYWALMDYGTHLKRSGVRVNTRSAHHVPQKKFAGSMREARGAILRELAAEPGFASRSNLEEKVRRKIGTERHAQIAEAIKTLVAEGFIEKDGPRYRLAQ